MKSAGRKQDVTKEEKDRIVSEFFKRVEESIDFSTWVRPTAGQKKTNRQVR